MVGGPLPACPRSGKAGATGAAHPRSQPAGGYFTFRHLIKISLSLPVSEMKCST